MSSSSGKDMSVYEFDENTTELARLSLICRSPKKTECPKVTKDVFKDFFSRKGSVEHTDTGEGLMSEYESSDVHDKRAGENSGEQCDSITGAGEFGSLITSISLQANDAGRRIGNNSGEQIEGSPTGSEAGQMTNSTSQEVKGATVIEQVISRLQICGQADLKAEFLEADASVHMVSNNDNDEQTTCTTPDPSEDMHVDLISEDEDLSAMNISPSNAMGDPSDDEGASEYSNSDTCHDSDGYHDMEECEDMEILVTPEFVLCGRNTFLGPRLTFSADWVRLEILKQNSSCDEAQTFQWSLFDIECLKTFWLSHVGVAVVILDLKDSAGIELQTCFSSSGAPNLFFAFSDSGWHQQEHRIISLSDTYNKFWKSLDESVYENEITIGGVHFEEYSEAFDDYCFGRFEQTLDEFVFPKGDPDAVTISGRDVELLEPGTFINDTLIDFYIKYLQSTISESQKQACHFFNSFFFRKLADLDKVPDTEVVSREAFLRVRKWTRRVNIFKKDYIFIPVNYSYHWSLIVICNPGAAILEDDNRSKTPCILHMDSINGTHANLRKLIQSYLWEEWRERHTVDEASLAAASENFYNMSFISLEVPQQTNMCDCGLFLLHYVEMFLREAPTAFSLSQLANTAYFLTRDWFVPAEASSLKRYHIRQLIYKLYKNVSGTGPVLSYGTGQQSYKAAQSDIGTSLEVEFVLEDCSANQRYSGNSILPDGRLKQISDCHMDIGSGKSFGVVHSEYDGTEAEQHFSCDEGFRSFSQDPSQLKSTLRQPMESVDKRTEDFPSEQQINQFSSGIFNHIGTNQPGQSEKETLDIGVSTSMPSGIQFDLLANELNGNTDPLFNEQEEHSGSSSERVLCRVLEESSQCVRKSAACDTSAWKKLKDHIDRVDEPEDKISEENEKAASVPQLKDDQLKLSPERSSRFDRLPCAGQVSKINETLVAGVSSGEDSQRIACHEINMQRLEQENALNLKTGFSDNTSSSPHEAVVAGSLEDPENGIIGSFVSAQDDGHSLDCNVDSDQTLLDKSKHLFPMEDFARCADKTSENGSRGSFDKESADSITKTVENVGKGALVSSQNDRHSLDSNVYADCTSLDKSKHSFSMEDSVRCADKTPGNGVMVAVGREFANSIIKTIENVDQGADRNVIGNEDMLISPGETCKTPAGNEELNVIVDKRECIDSVRKTIDNVDKVIDQKERAESLPDLEDNTGRTPENRKIYLVGDAECLSSNDFSSPPQGLIVSRNPRSRKTPLTVPKGGNLDGYKVTEHVLERPRTRSVTKSMDSAKVNREKRRRILR